MMNDEQLFLAEIADRRDDDAPRLIYADWLEERGDYRAELIRVQIELANREDGRNDRYLSDREQELLGRLLSELKEFGVERATARRGFVESVKMRARFLLSHAQPLFRAAPLLVEVRLWDAARHIDRIAQLPEIARLGILALPGDLIRESGAAALSQSPYLSQLVHLDLRGNLIGDAGVRYLAQSDAFGELWDLNLNANGLSRAAVEYLAEAAHMPYLQNVHLRNNRVGPREEVLARLSRLRHVTEHDLYV